LNVACGKRYNLLELIEALHRILDTRLMSIHAPPRPGDVRHSQADISKARSMPGYRVGVAFKEELKRAVEWYKSNRSLCL
jgi:UDP-glucose 4-epimerase